VTSSEIEGTRELRLAVVCYGGSSLAIYMHGVTKELHRLVRASALLEAGKTPAAPSESSYTALLSELAGGTGVGTRVSVDVIAGTSAGGINGVYLAKGVARNRSQDALRDLWFTRGDMSELVVGPRRVPWKARLFARLPSTLKKSPLRGADMARWLFDALEGMDRTTEPDGLDTLVPREGRLDLFVTVTDFYGYDRQVPIADPKLVHDRRHRHALTFTYGDGLDQFQPANNGALAFAARATSCFPGVFPPVSFASFREWVPTADLRDLDRCFRSHALVGQSAANTQFVDGGVLDNKPFGWAIGAIRERRADVEVDRRLVYLEPDPGDRFVLDTTPKPAPTTVKAIGSSVAGLPRQEPILDDLLEVEALNRRVRRIRDVIETSFPHVRDFVAGVIGSPDSLPDDPGADVFAGWSAKVNAQVIDEAGLAYATYLRLKISGTVDRFAKTICDVCVFPDDSNHAELVRVVMRQWARERKLFEQSPTPTDAQREFLRRFDLGYGERRLSFVIAAFRWWYRDLAEGEQGIPPRADLDKGKKLLYDAVDELDRTLGGGDFDDALRAQVKACFPDDEVHEFLLSAGLDAGAYLERKRSALEAMEQAVWDFAGPRLDGYRADLYRGLYELSAGWPGERRRDLLVRYLGFPLWDVLLYPIQALADAGENDEVDVQRLSPYEAQVLSTPPADKVHGKRLMHFWAFFDRTARENDYLWGRLDGAAHLIGILLPGGKADPGYRAWCMKAFAAILDEDEQALSHIPATVKSLRDEVARG
jgi:patatin-related protein